MQEFCRPGTLVEHLIGISELLDEHAEFRPFGETEPAGVAIAADATSKFVVGLGGGGQGFLTLSGEGNPDLVARSVRNISAIRSKLSGRLAGPVVPPLEAGMVQGFSYAIWPMLEAVPEGRLKRHVAKRRIAPDVLEWLAGVCGETLTSPTEAGREKIAGNLLLLQEDPHHPNAVREGAALATDRMAAGKWVPCQCVQHSDLWLGNVMMAPPGSERAFAVIDWGGATLSGFPFFDLCRFAISCNLPTRQVRQAVGKLTDRLDMEPIDVASSVLCSIGQMQTNLEFFPEYLFRSMAAETANYAFDVVRGAI